MHVVGKTDSFERKYKEKFRSLAAEYGEIVRYERDRGARDIGVHLTHRMRSGEERLSTALCWFQMKGIMASTLSNSDYETSKDISVRLQVNHLQYWYLQPVPTYLALYIECVDHFLVINIQDYITRTWGRDVLVLEQATVSVPVTRESILDDQAFRLVLRNSNIEEYKRALGSESADVHLCNRDYDLIWQFGTAVERNAEHRLVYWDWQSKTRGQLFIEERRGDLGDSWSILREHWQYRMKIPDLQVVYPYLDFAADEDREDALSWTYENGEQGAPEVTLPNGDVVSGEDPAGEYFEYQMRAKLNEIGNQAFEWVKKLEEIGLIEVTPGASDIISVAPWHGRDV